MCFFSLSSLPRFAFSLSIYDPSTPVYYSWLYLLSSYNHLIKWYIYLFLQATCWNNHWLLKQDCWKIQVENWYIVHVIPSVAWIYLVNKWKWQKIYICANRFSQFILIWNAQNIPNWWSMIKKKWEELYWLKIFFQFAKKSFGGGKYTDCPTKALSF